MIDETSNKLLLESTNHAWIKSLTTVIGHFEAKIFCNHLQKMVYCDICNVDLNLLTLGNNKRLSIQWKWKVSIFDYKKKKHLQNICP